MRRPSTRIRRRPRRAGQGLFEACDETGFGPTFGIFDLDKSHCFGNSVRTPEDYSRSATWKMGLDPSEVPPAPRPPPPAVRGDALAARVDPLAAPGTVAPARKRFAVLTTGNRRPGRAPFALPMPRDAEC